MPRPCHPISAISHDSRQRRWQQCWSNLAAASGTTTLEQTEQLLALADEVEADKEAFCRYFKVDGIAQLKAKDFDRAIAALNKKRKA